MKTYAMIEIAQKSLKIDENKKGLLLVSCRICTDAPSLAIGILSRFYFMIKRCLWLRSYFLPDLEGWRVLSMKKITVIYPTQNTLLNTSLTKHSVT